MYGGTLFRALPWRRLAAAAAAAAAALCVDVCGSTALPAPPTPTSAELAQLGREIFFDTSLSSSGKMACATCHNPQHAYGPANGLAVQLGGPGLNASGLRAVPSLRYALNRTPRWTKQFQANPLERIIETDSVPTGGLARDGRFNTLHEQARAPLLGANEMANLNVAAIVDKLKLAPYAARFEHVFGAGILQQPERVFAKLLESLERFQLDDASFHPYTSKFDRHLQGKVALSVAETRGLRLFVDPRKGNCAACHTASPGADGSPPLFTDFSFAALGVPRNPRIAANVDPRFFDLGLCGPIRTDQVANSSYCGMFKTPTLRNVATRKVFMHNGVFGDLSDAVRFYAERDLKAAKWYPRKSDGSIDRYNDLPAKLRGNVDVINAPFNLPSGAKSALTEAEVRDIVAFLRTLTDQDVAK